MTRCLHLSMHINGQLRTVYITLPVGYVSTTVLAVATTITCLSYKNQCSEIYSHI